MILQMLILLAGLSPQADLHALADNVPLRKEIQPSEKEMRFALGNNRMNGWKQYGGFSFYDDWENPGSTRKWSDWYVRHLGQDTGGTSPEAPLPDGPGPTTGRPEPPAPPVTPVPEPASMILLAAGAIPLLRRRR
jgi:hypothetical protein